MTTPTTHQDTLASWQEQNDWALLAMRNADFAHAQQILKSLLAVIEPAGETPQLVVTLELLSDALVAQSNFAESEPLLKRALRIRIDKQGTIHDKVADCMNKLARVEFQMMKYAEAASLLTRAVEIYTKLLGADHQTTMAVQQNLARVSEAQAKYMQTKKTGWSVEE